MMVDGSPARYSAVRRVFASPEVTGRLLPGVRTITVPVVPLTVDWTFQIPH